MEIIKLRNHDVNIIISDNITLKEFGHVYLFKNKINNKIYIGQSVRVRDRISEHIQNVINKKKYVLYNAINKYGLENFEISIIDSAESIEELNEKEINYIKNNKSNSREFGYNIEEGGRNAKASAETKQLLSDQRRGRKQNSEWVKKRIEIVSLPVLKVDLLNDVILDRYYSLADAGRNNKDGLSYQQILSKCLGKSKNNINIYWCYEKDYISNNLKNYEPKKFKQITEFNEDKLVEIYNEYKNKNLSIRSLSKKYLIHFSTLSNYINEKEKPKNNNINLDEINLLICKKTNKRFTDVKNKSGTLTIHICSIYPEFKLESKFKRKQIENKTGLPWYYEYFLFIKEKY